MESGNAAQWASAIATAIGLGLTSFALFKRHRDLRALEFDRSYRKHRRDLALFRTTLRHEWGEFRKVTPNCPESLATFLKEVALPPLDTTGDQIARMADDGTLTPTQRLMWAFASAIYPMRAEEAEVTAQLRSETDSSEFHRARGDLSWFWHTEPRGGR
jgi:hypothetical protein